MQYEKLGDKSLHLKFQTQTLVDKKTNMFTFSK